MAPVPLPNSHPWFLMLSVSEQSPMSQSRQGSCKGPCLSCSSLRVSSLTLSTGETEVQGGRRPCIGRAGVGHTPHCSGCLSSLQGDPWKGASPKPPEAGTWEEMGEEAPPSSAQEALGSFSLFSPSPTLRTPGKLSDKYRDVPHTPQAPNRCLVQHPHRHSTRYSMEPCAAA